MADLTIVIPARITGDPSQDGKVAAHRLFLMRTVQDVLDKARGDISVYVMVDGFNPLPGEIISDPRLVYEKMDSASYLQKRQAINRVIAETSGRWVMSLDAHCMMAEGFDVVLEHDYIGGTVMVPRRNRLDAEAWKIQVQCDERPPIDYEHTMWPRKFDPKPGLHGFRWDERTRARQNILIDDQMHFQGSCWIMERTWFERMDLMQVQGYTGWGQEAEEIGLKTWRAGGRVLTDKNTWYAHLHKGPTYGRGYFMNKSHVDGCNKYSYEYWVYENKPFFIKFIEQFWPVPGWPRDWQDQLYGRA